MQFCKSKFTFVPTSLLSPLTEHIILSVLSINTTSFQYFILCAMIWTSYADNYVCSDVFLNIILRYHVACTILVL